MPEQHSSLLEAYESLGISRRERSRSIERATYKFKFVLTCLSPQTNFGPINTNACSWEIHEFDEAATRLHLIQRDLELENPGNITCEWLMNRHALGVYIFRHMA